MDKQIKELFYQYMLESDFTEAEIDAMGTPLYIEYTSFNNVRVSFTVGIGLFVIGILLIFIKYKKLIQSEQNIEEKKLGLEL